MKDCFFSYPNSYPIYASRIICTIYAIYCPVIVTVNVALIVSLFATKQSMLKTSNLLIVCLSISDCLIGAVLMPMLFVRSLWFDSERLCFILDVSFPLQFLFCGISFNMTMLLAVDRYIHMNPNVIEDDSKVAKLFQRPGIYFLIFSCLVFFTGISVSLHLLMKINPHVTAYFTAFTAVFLLITMPIFVTIYTRSYLRIRRFVADNPVYQNRGEADSNESPEYLKKLFKTVFLLIVAVIISYLPFLALNLSTTVLNFVDYADIRSTKYLILAHTAMILQFSNSFVNALIIFYRNKESRKWLGKCLLPSCCKQRKKGEKERSSEVIINIAIEDRVSSMVQNDAHDSTDNT